jgi:hypothetical protein
MELMKNLVNPRGGAIQMVPQNHEKVKRIVGCIVRKGSARLSVPEQKFTVEMILGMLKTGSCNLTQIARNLGEEIEVKHTLKRLQRMASHEAILDLASEIALHEASRKVSTETIFALDIGDSIREYGRSFDLAATVKDGSTGELKMGYWLNQVSGINPRSKEIFPVQLDIFSTKEAGYRSQNAESIGMIGQVVGKVGKKGLWAMDRGYDAGIMLEYLLSSELTFIVRMKESRDILVHGQGRNIGAVAESVNRRTKWSSHARFGSKKVTMVFKGKEYELTLIVLKDKRNKGNIMWLTSGWIRSTKELKRRIRGYFHRWGVEESYRFEKQGFGIEKSVVRKYSSTKTMIGLTLLGWLALVKLNERPKLAKAITQAARMEKVKGSKGKPKFNYYRLLQGVRNTLAYVIRLCGFRRKKQTQEPHAAYPLFARILVRTPPAVMEMEFAS